MGCLYLFGMYGNLKRPLAIPWHQISIPQAFIKFTGENRLVRRGLTWLSRNEPAGYELKHFIYILYSCLFLQPLFYHTERNDNCTFYAWEGSFLSSNTHFNSTLNIYGSIWLNFEMVPIHPAWCANSPHLCQFAPDCREFHFL